jgi:hypothetical protein
VRGSWANTTSSAPPLVSNTTLRPISDCSQAFAAAMEKGNCVEVSRCRSGALPGTA